jgi:hypothetical protein
LFGFLRVTLKSLCLGGKDEYFFFFMHMILKLSLVEIYLYSLPSAARNLIGCIHRDASDPITFGLYSLRFLGAPQNYLNLPGHHRPDWSKVREKRPLTMMGEKWH